MLRNPVYVQADLDVYEFFKSQGTIIVNDAADFTGMNGCYLYQGRDVKPSKKNDLKDQMLVPVSYTHLGISPSVEPISNGHQRLVLSVAHAVHGQDTGLSLIHI